MKKLKAWVSSLALAAAFAAPAQAQDRIGDLDEASMQTRAFVRLGWGGPPAEPRLRYGLGVYNGPGCAAGFAGLSRSACSERALTGVELRAAGRESLGVWLTGEREANLVSYNFDGSPAQAGLVGAASGVGTVLLIGLGVAAGAAAVASASSKDGGGAGDCKDSTVATGNGCNYNPLPE